MAGRPKIFQEEKAIEKAIDLFWKKGYEGTSMDDLLKAMSIGKGSLYHSFRGKKNLFKRSIDHFFSRFITEFSEALETCENPVELIKDLFRSIAVQSKEMHRKGCFLGNTISELATVEPSLGKLAASKLAMLEEVFYKYINSAQRTGKISSRENPRLLARYLVNLWNGIQVTRRMYPDKKALANLIEFQLKVLD